MERDEVVPEKVQQVAEVVDQPIEIREYRRGFYKFPSCGWSDYSPVPLGVKEGFRYGARLSSIVGWLGYGGNLTWRKQEHFIEYVFGIPISQGSLGQNAQMVSRKFRTLDQTVVKVHPAARNPMC